MAEPVYKIRIGVDTDGAKGGINKFQAEFKDFTAKNEQAAKSFEKYATGATAKRAKDEKKAFKEVTKAMEAEYQKRRADAQGNDRKVAAEHEAHLKRMLALEKEHARRVEALDDNRSKKRPNTRGGKVMIAAGSGNIGSAAMGLGRMAGPAGMAVAAVGAAVVAGVKAVSEWVDASRQLEGSLKKLGDAGGYTEGQLKGMKAELMNIPRDAETGAAGVMEIANTFEPIKKAGESITEIAAGVMHLKTAAKGMGEELDMSALKPALDAVGAVTGSTTKAIDVMAAAAQEMAGGSLSAMVEKIQSGEVSIQDLAARFGDAEGAAAAMADASGVAVGGAGQSWENLKTKIGDAATGAWDEMTGWLDNAVSAWDRILESAGETADRTFGEFKAVDKATDQIEKLSGSIAKVQPGNAEQAAKALADVARAIPAIKEVSAETAALVNDILDNQSLTTPQKLEQVNNLLGAAVIKGNELKGVLSSEAMTASIEALNEALGKTEGFFESTGEAVDKQMANRDVLKTNLELAKAQIAEINASGLQDAATQARKAELLKTQWTIQKALMDTNKTISGYQEGINKAVENAVILAKEGGDVSAESINAILQTTEGYGEMGAVIAGNAELQGYLNDAITKAVTPIQAATDAAAQGGGMLSGLFGSITEGLTAAGKANAALQAQMDARVETAGKELEGIEKKNALLVRTGDMTEEDALRVNIRAYEDQLEALEKMGATKEQILEIEADLIGLIDQSVELDKKRLDDQTALNDLKVEAGKLSEADAIRENIALYEEQLEKIRGTYNSEEEVLEIEAKLVDLRQQSVDLQRQQFDASVEMVNLRVGAGELTDVQAEEELLKMYEAQLDVLIAQGAAREDVLKIKGSIKGIRDTQAKRKEDEADKAQKEKEKADQEALKAQEKAQREMEKAAEEAEKAREADIKALEEHVEALHDSADAAKKAAQARLEEMKATGQAVSGLSNVFRTSIGEINDRRKAVLAAIEGGKGKTVSIPTVAAETAKAQADAMGAAIAGAIGGGGLVAAMREQLATSERFAKTAPMTAADRTMLEQANKQTAAFVARTEARIAELAKAGKTNVEILQALKADLEKFGTVEFLRGREKAERVDLNQAGPIRAAIQAVFGQVGGQRGIGEFTRQMGEAETAAKKTEEVTFSADPEEQRKAIEGVQSLLEDMVAAEKDLATYQKNREAAQKALNTLMSKEASPEQIAEAAAEYERLNGEMKAFREQDEGRLAALQAAMGKFGGEEDLLRRVGLMMEARQDQLRADLAAQRKQLGEQKVTANNAAIYGETAARAAAELVAGLGETIPGLEEAIKLSETDLAKLQTTREEWATRSKQLDDRLKEIGTDKSMEAFSGTMQEAMNALAETAGTVAPKIAGMFTGSDVDAIVSQFKKVLQESADVDVALAKTTTGSDERAALDAMRVKLGDRLNQLHGALNGFVDTLLSGGGAVEKLKEGLADISTEGLSLFQGLGDQALALAQNQKAAFDSLEALKASEALSPADYAKALAKLDDAVGAANAQFMASVVKSVQAASDQITGIAGDIVGLVEAGIGGADGGQIAMGVGDIMTKVGEVLLTAPVPALQWAGAAILGVGFLTKIITGIVELFSQIGGLEMKQQTKLLEDQLTLYELQNAALDRKLAAEQALNEVYRTRRDEAGEQFEEAKTGVEDTKAAAAQGADILGGSVFAEELGLDKLKDFDLSTAAGMDAFNKALQDAKDKVAEFGDLSTEEQKKAFRQWYIEVDGAGAAWNLFSGIANDANADYLALVDKGLDDTLDAFNDYMKAVGEANELRREVFRDQLMEVEHREKIGEFEGREKDALEEKIAIMEQLYAQALKDYNSGVDGLLTKQELYGIEEELYALKLQQVEAERGLNAEYDEGLSLLHRQRQEMILATRGGPVSADQRAQVEAMQAQIIARMRELGASEEEIARQQAAFQVASYDVGTPYVDQDQLARVHQGERIFTRTENTRLLDIMGAWADAMQRTNQGAILSGGGGQYAITINVSGATNPQATATAVRQELDRWHEEAHRRNGTANGR